MNVNSVNSATAAQTAPAPQDTAKLKKSAREFEALLIGQMMKAARESGGGWFGTGEDEASATLAGYAEEQFAQTIASQGGLGIASMLEKGLAADQARLDSRVTTKP